MYGLKTVKGASPDSPDERCNPEPASLAAASYIKKLLAEDFGNGTNQTTFAIAAYNSGEDGLRANINKTKDLAKTEPISYWTLLENKDKQSEQFQAENVNYVPKFFASAIVGENPKVFDVEMQPLSSNTKQIKPIAVEVPTSEPKLYWQMTYEEKLKFTREMTRHIKALIQDDSNELEEEALWAIIKEIEWYMKKKGLPIEVSVSGTLTCDLWARQPVCANDKSRV